MSTLAKVFVIFNLVLAVVFFGSSATLFLMRYNWREAYETTKREYSSQLEQLKEDFKEPMAAMQAVREDNARLKTDAANLAAESSGLKDRIATLETSVSESQLTAQKLSTANEQAQATIQTLTEKLAQLNSQIDTLRRSAEDALAAKDKAVRAQTRLKIDLDKTQSMVSALEIEKAELNDEVDKYEIMIANLAKKGIDAGDYTVPPIEGLVEAVNNKDQLVVLSVGKDQEVREGYKFAVRRGGEYIGKVTVIEVYEDLSGARIDFTAGETQIMVGDKVETTSL